MLNWMLRKIMGTKNERELKRLAPMVVRVNGIPENPRKFILE